MSATIKETWRLGEVSDALRARAERGARAATSQLRSETIAMLSHPGSGRIYGKHQASAPGEPPAPDTGQLRLAVVEDVRSDAAGITGRVIENKDYAAPLETGTDKMAARPHLRRSLVEGWDRIYGAFKANF